MSVSRYFTLFKNGVPLIFSAPLFESHKRRIIVSFPTFQTIDGKQNFHMRKYRARRIPVGGGGGEGCTRLYAVCCTRAIWLMPQLALFLRHPIFSYHPPATRDTKQYNVSKSAKHPNFCEISFMLWIRIH